MSQERGTRTSYRERRWTPRKRGPVLWWTITLGAACFAGWWHFWTPGAAWVETYYSRGVYPLGAALVTGITGLFEGSVALVLISAAAVAAFMAFVLRWRQLRRDERSRLDILPWMFKWVLPISLVLYAAFIVIWAAGYRRPPVETRLGFDTAAPEAGEMEALGAALLEEINAFAASADARDADAAIASIGEAMEAVLADWEEPALDLPRRVKETPKGLLLMSGTAGICSPLTLEPHVDGGLPDTAFVYIAAHELAHVAGYCGEADAAFLGFAAGLRAADPYARYAVACNAYRDLANRLPREEALAAFQALPPMAIEDFQRAREAAERYRITWFDWIKWNPYDTYLKAQGVKEGMHSYSRGITLLAWARRAGVVVLEQETGEPKHD